MAQEDLLRRVVAAVEAAGVDYMLTGSHASSIHGEPRSTHDIDVVVALDEARLPALLAAFPEKDYYRVSVRELISFLDREVPALARKQGHEQQPKHEIAKGEGEVFLSR